VTKYIKNKSIEPNNANDILDLKGVDKAIWNFISTLYKLEWDSLVTDKDNQSFRQKFSSKFTPKVQEIKHKPKNDKQTDKLANFAKLSPPIPAKTFKEVKEISRFFKRNSQLTEKKDTRKSYTQALSTSSNTKKILKIKETFPNLQAKKIENIQKIINNNSKPRPKLNMITKGLSRKQVIAPMNIKSEVMTDFICIDQVGIIIITNKVASPLNLQIILM